MRTGLLRDPGARAGLAVFVTGALLLALALFFGGGSAYGPLVAIGGVAILVAAAVAAATFAGLMPAPRLDPLGWTVLALLTGLVVWSGMSVWWSVAPDNSWEYVNRGFVYLAFLVIGLVVGAAVPGAPRVVAFALAGLLAAVMLWALAGKVIPNLFPDGARVARLRAPIDYWNGLALLASAAIPLALWLATRREHARAVRTAGVALVFVAGVTLLLTYSRGGVIVALIAVGAFLALTSQRLESVAALALAGTGAVVVAVWAFTQPGVSSDLQPYDVRLRDGLQFGIVLLGVAAVVVAATHGALAREERWSSKLRTPLSGRRLAVGAVVALLAVVLAASGGNPVAAARDRVRDFTNPASTTGTGPDRYGDINLNSRWTWWQEAWELFADQPLGGVGAGTFAVARRPIRTNTTYAVSPHNLVLQSLAETGIVGFLLLTGAVLAAALSIARTTARLQEREAAAASALAVGALAYGVHALIDYDWDFVALTAPVMIVVGVLLARGAAARRSRLWMAAALAAGPVLLFSLAAPWLADRYVIDAYAAIDRREPRAALDDADRARALNPLSIDALFASAAAYEAVGNERAALDEYVDAVDLQPRNWRTWYELGRFELQIEFHDLAIAHLRRSRELDPLGPGNDLLASMGL
jgi:tetratricopeptide (TPR) repeat protein